MSEIIRLDPGAQVAQRRAGQARDPELRIATVLEAGASLTCRR